MDVTSALGVDFQYMASPRHYLPQTMGGRSALFDYDNDGRLDLFLVNGAPIKDPATKGTILAENWAQLLESSLSPEAGRHFRGCYREMAGREPGMGQSGRFGLCLDSGT